MAVPFTCEVEAQLLTCCKGGTEGRGDTIYDHLMEGEPDERGQDEGADPVVPVPIVGGAPAGHCGDGEVSLLQRQRELPRDMQRERRRRRAA